LNAERDGGGWFSGLCGILNLLDETSRRLQVIELGDICLEPWARVDDTAGEHLRGFAAGVAAGQDAVY
jgi:hypothetical protein